MSTLTTPTTTAHRWSVSARVGAAGIAAFFATSVATAALTPGYRTAREAISALAATDSRYAPVMITGFLLAAIGLAATGIALWRRFGAALSGRIAAGLVILGSGLTATAGLARQDCSEARESCIDHGEGALASTHFWVHQYVSLALFVTLVIASFVLIRATRRTDGFAHLAVPTRIMAYVLLLTTLAAMTVGFGAVNGLVQRPYLALLFGWPVLLAGSAPRTGR
jgi:hypothetical membrane protein